MSRGVTLLIGRLPTISGELAGLAASARRVISMMATRVCLLPPPLCPADGARVHVITQISPSALSLLTTLSGYTMNMLVRVKEILLRQGSEGRHASSWQEIIFVDSPSGNRCPG